MATFIEYLHSYYNMLSGALYCCQTCVCSDKMTAIKTSKKIHFILEFVEKRISDICANILWEIKAIKEGYKGTKIMANIITRMWDCNCNIFHIYFGGL